MQKVLDNVALIACSAIAVGILDAAFIATHTLGAAGAFQYVPPRIWLVAPLVWLAVAAAGAIPAFVISRRHGAAIDIAGLVALFAGLRLRGVSHLLAAAAMLVTFAFALPLARRIHIGPPQRRVAWSAVMIALVGLIAAVAVAHPTPAPPLHRAGARASAPNVLVIFLDTVRYDAVFEATGEVRPELPSLRRFASQSAVFDAAYAAAPWTLPSHLAAVTGLPAHELGVDFTHQTYEKSVPTLAERFRRAGYRTAAVISNTFLHPRSGFGRGFDTYEHAANALDLCRTAPGGLLDGHWPRFGATVCNWGAHEVTRRALAQMNGDAPYLLVVNFMDAHDPYFADCPGAHDNPSYRTAIRCLDTNVGTLLARAGMSKRNTIVVIASDHGEQFGEHGLLRHGNSLYRELLHVPLMIRMPDRHHSRVTTPISLAGLPSLLTSTTASAHAVVSTLTTLEGLREISVIRGTSQLITRGDVEEWIDLSTGLRSPPPALEPQLRADTAAVKRSWPSLSATDFRSVGYIH